MNNRKQIVAGGRRNPERGAALVIAIAIMTILLAVALTFYAISRQEVENATNVKNRVQADLLVDSALAIAMAEINRNFSLHPEATSLDHALFTKFNGSWAVGKEWALWKPDGVNALPLQNGGIPQPLMTAMPDIRFGDGVVEPMFSGGRSAPWLYIPRFEGSGIPVAYAPVLDDGTGSAYTRIFDLNPNAPSPRPPFVTPAFYGVSETDGFNAERYPLEWINTWTDVDNDGDGLRDAIWIPIARELYFSGGDSLDDGTPNRVRDFFVDNDLDGMIDEVQDDGFDDDGDGTVGDIDEQMETAPFVYDGKNDGLDNDGDGLIDGADLDESPGSANEGFFLTTRLPGLTIPVDLNADGIVPDLVPDGATGNLVPLTVTLPNNIIVNITDRDGNVLPPITLTSAHVDVIDNDYDMLANDFHVYAYAGPNTNPRTMPPLPPFQFTGFEDTGVLDPGGSGFNIIRSLEKTTLNSNAPEGSAHYADWRHVGNWYPGDVDLFGTARLKSYEDINLDWAFGGALAFFPASSSYYSESSGSVEVINYAANLTNIIRITHSGEPVCELAGRAAITVRDEASKINMNVAGAHTYEPIVGRQRSLGEGNTTAELETRILPDVGIARADAMAQQLTGYPQNDGLLTLTYAEDVAYPGYGRVDDNANILLAALDGRDNDGDGLVDEGLRLPPLDDPLFDAYYAELGAWEGLDDPSELQRYRPLPNLVAEDRNPYNITGFVDGIDNNDNGIFNERGELGDLQLRDTLDLLDAPLIGDATYGYMRHSVSAYSSDRNTNFVTGDGGIRAINKLDYNFATPQQIAANLILTNSYEVTTERADAFGGSTTAARYFASGLLQGDVHIRSSLARGTGLMWQSISGVPTPNVELLPADGILQVMQAAVDIVDNRDRGHGRSVLTTERQDVLRQVGYDDFPQSLGLRERIPESELFPLEALQAHLRDAMDINRTLEFRDDWWTFTANVGGFNAVPEQRKISYTATGNEAIRINELMVRPVRRVEAEAVPNEALAVGNDPMSVFTPAALLNYDPTPYDATLGSNNVLPEFNVIRNKSFATGGGWQFGGAGYLGEEAYLGIAIDVDDPTSIADGDDILEFAIQPSEGLPPGRYYLTLDARLDDGSNTVTSRALNDEELQVAVKYTSTAFPAPILAEAGIAPWLNIENDFLSETIPGAPDGWAFVNGTAPNPGLVPGYFLDGLPAEPFPADPIKDTQSLTGPTFAVTVPPFNSDYELHIAIRVNPDHILNRNGLGPADDIFVAINGLEFSQEPDHEWVELVNVSNDVVNIGGWELEVGVPDKPSVPTDPFKSRWTVPPGTEIAPGGMVLLAFNKFDYFRNGGGVSRIFDNGMGLADSDITVGPLLPYVSNGVSLPSVFGDASSGFAPNDDFYDESGDVFYRPDDPDKGLVDYVDRDGDGVTSYAYALDGDPTTPDTDATEVEGNLASSKEFSSLISTTNLPWDRIIQLSPRSVVTNDNPYSPAPIERTLDDIDTLEDVAAFVLRGGVLPNYPERDRVDNDGDGGYVEFLADIDGDTYRDPLYVPGVLDRDMVDNDGDDLIDERGEAKPTLADAPDPYGIPAGGNGDGVNPRLSEGVDEGALLQAGYYTNALIPLQFQNDRSAYPNDQNYRDFDGTILAPPGDNLRFEGGVLAGAIGIDTTVMPVGLVNFVDPAVVGNEYVGSNFDPADWKAFVERRWYPGDNVIVSLYEGPATSSAVVDRVTYREFDVINRTIDDIAPSPYTDPAYLPNPGMTSLWRPNHMGLDYYRSLERKHPAYNGDRFGTENRWQATDGNYDDWSDSLSYFEAELGSDSTASPVLISDADRVEIRPRFTAGVLAYPLTDPDTLLHNAQIYGHAMAGSPLRMNTAARHSQNPPDLVLARAGIATVQFPNTLNYFRTHEDGIYPTDTTNKTLQNQSWNHYKAVVANRPFQSPGDLMRVPHQVYLHDAVNTFGAAVPMLRDMTMLNTGLQADGVAGDGVSVTQDIALRSATLGQDYLDIGATGNLLREAANSMALDPVRLTVGQAEFHPIRPELAPGNAINADILNWVDNPNSGDPDDLWAPATWAPFFLFELPDDGAARTYSLDFLPNYPGYIDGTNINELVPRHYLFNIDYMQINAGAYYNLLAAETRDRWTLEQRTAMYVSQNRAGVQPAEGLWIWDGADGLENGEYVVYVGTYVPEMSRSIEVAASASANGVAARGLSAKAEQGFAALNSGNTTTYTLGDGTAVPMDRVTASLLRRDPTNDNPFYAQGQEFDPTYAIDVITDPTEARGRAPLASTVADPSSKPGGLIHPDDWNPTIVYKADDDGYIFYGNNAAGGWRPQIVRVTDNFLALRVRNVGTEAQVGAITHVVLAPRKRTQGRLNVNTAQSRVVPKATNSIHEYVSTLMALPGVVDVARTVVPSVTGAGPLAPAIDPLDDVALMDLDDSSASFPLDGSWSSPISLYDAWAPATPPERNLRTADVANPDYDLLVNNGVPLVNRHSDATFRMNAMLMTGRREHADGRYYESVGDLVLDSSAFDYDYGLSRADVPSYATGGTADTPVGIENAAIYPLSNESDPSKRFDEVYERFRRLGNLVTTRSDVYEITMTVESGYGVDRNEDGIVNYRDPDEFVTTSATKATAVYERRTPSDQSDGG